MSVKKSSKQNFRDNLKKKIQEDNEQALLEASTRYVQHESLDRPVPDKVVPSEKPEHEIRVPEIIQSELQAARLLNVDMPDEPREFIALLEDRVKQITGTRKNVILILDEESGTYRCLNDEKDGDIARSPRELTWISDHYLQDLLGADQVLHNFLHHKGNIFGIVAIAEKEDGTPFNLRDEIVLEQLTQYLSVQVNHFLVLKRTLTLPTIQRILLRISNKLLTAVDSTAIFHSTLESMTEELPFTAGQFIQLDRITGEGQILYQRIDDEPMQGMPLGQIEHFSSILSLFHSQVWKHGYLYLKSETLGDKSFSELFGIPDVKSVLLIPLMSEDGPIDSALVLFQQEQAKALSKEALVIAEQVGELVMSACARAKVLEKALEFATTDELTGTVNRRGFYSRINAEVERARRNQMPLCLAMMDLDYFKCVNDTYGHLVGDEILRGFVERIEQNIRKSDLLCRFGGEEFALMLPETTPKAAHELVERLRRKVEKHAIMTSAGPIHITFSAGVALVETVQGLSRDAKEVISQSLAKSDEALYEAKQLGRDRVILCED